MATVQQVHRFLSNQALGNVGRQKELNEAIHELNKRRVQHSNPIDNNKSALRVTRKDRLYQLYEDALKTNAHQFERRLGSLRCIIQTNCLLEDADIVCLFLHGLGASPWHFYRVATSFHDQHQHHVAAGKDRIKIAFLFPFAPCKMEPGDFGAVEDCIYGSYKWWDVFLRETEKPRLDPGKSTVPSGLLAAASFVMPTVIREAQPSPRRWVSEDPLSPKNRSVHQGPPSAGLLRDLMGVHNESTLLARGTSRQRILQQQSQTRGALAGLTSSIQQQSKVQFSTSTTPSPHQQWLEEDMILEEVATPDQRKDGLFQTMFCSCSSDVPTELKVSYENPRGRDEARQAVESLLADLASKFRITTDRIALCGFSQGAMLALDVFHRTQLAPAALGIFSGAPMCVDQWKTAMNQKANKYKFRACPIIQSHGKSDWIFPPFVGRWLNRFLEREGLNVVEYIEFEGEHELPLSVVDRLTTLLLQVGHSRRRAPSPLSSSTFNHTSSAPKRMDTSSGRLGARWDELSYK